MKTKQVFYLEGDKTLKSVFACDLLDRFIHILVLLNDS